jgi:hypothetical protein
MFSPFLVSRNSKSLTNILIKFWNTYEVSLWPFPSARHLYCIQRLPSTGNLESTFPLKFNVPSFTGRSQCWPLTPKQTCTFRNVPHRTADITLIWFHVTLIARILCLNTVLQFLQSKWTALHVLFFINSTIMVSKLTHVTTHNFVPWTLCTLTKHWTPTLRSFQEHYEPYQNFLTAVCFPGPLCSYLMPCVISEKHKFCHLFLSRNESVSYFPSILCAVLNTALLRHIFLLHPSQQHYFPLCTLCTSVVKSSLLTKSTIHHSVHYVQYDKHSHTNCCHLSFGLSPILYSTFCSTEYILQAWCTC